MPIRTVVREKSVVKEQPVGFICNGCGKTHDFEHEFNDSYGFHAIQLGGGYGDHFPGDMQTMTIVICEDCLREWVSTFKFPDVLDPPVFLTKHSETGEVLALTECLAHPPDMPKDEVHRLLKEAYAIYEDDNHPIWEGMPEFHGGVWEHFKGKRYFVEQEYIHFTPDLTPCVLYRELHGDSRYWLHPMRMWEEQVERGEYKGPCFRRIREV